MGGGECLSLLGRAGVTVDETPIGQAILRVTDATDALIGVTDAPGVTELMNAALDLGHMVMDLLHELGITED